MFKITLRRLLKNKLATAGGIIFLIFLLAAIFAPLIAPYDYAEQDLYNTLAGPSLAHLCGTDEVGRDILSRLIYGGRYSIRIGILSVVLAAGIGVPLGAAAGFYGGRLDNVLMRFMDIFQAIPNLMLAIALSATLGAGVNNCILALGITSMPAFARMTRASILNVRGMEYVEAARSTNSRDFRIIVKHVLPNAMAPLLVQATMGVATAILNAASLSFIGLGVQPPLPEWGAMLSTGRTYIRDCWHMCVFPGLTIFLTVMSLNLFGDGLRDALDPRMKN
ncbi:MAG: ABC transporter permease [Lachnospiraceae bacterium]|nr:ABC transporter permease [Lachnospiraceae bacterium]